MRQSGAIALGGIAGGILALAACVYSPDQRPAWRDQLVPDSPCYRVDLLDGLDEESTDEVQDLFACLDHHDHLSSMRPLFAALEDPTRTGQPAAIALARSVNAMPDADVDPFALAGIALDFVQSEDRPIEEMLDLVLELIYGVRASKVRETGFVLTSPANLQAGLLSPLAPVLPAAAGAMLDDDLDTAVWAGELIVDPETKRWIRTFDDIIRSTNPNVHDPLSNLLPGMGEAILATRTPGNTLWNNGSGDSLRDLMVGLTQGVGGRQPLLEAVAPEAHAMLSDPIFRTKLQTLLVELHDDGILQTTPEELAWLASVDLDENALAKGEMSGLAHFVRLLHDTNQPMQCSLDVIVTTIDVDLGNLAVSILQTIAGQDPDLVDGGVSIIGSVVGWDLSQWLMDSFANSGICPALTTDVVEDMRALDLLYSGNADHLLELFVRILTALEESQQDRIPEFVDLASDLHAVGAVPPTEELLRDLGSEPVMDDVIDLVPVLARPVTHGITAGDEPAADLQDALSLAVWIFAEDSTGETGWHKVEPLISAVVLEDGLWIAVGNAGPLLADEQSQTARLLDLVPSLLDVDPELTLLDELGPLLGNRAIATPLLEMVETERVGETLLTSEPLGQDPEVPLAFGGRLVVNGALEALLDLMDILLGALDDSSGS